MQQRRRVYRRMGAHKGLENLEKNHGACLYWSKRSLSGSAVNDTTLTPRVKMRMQRIIDLLFKLDYHRRCSKLQRNSLDPPQDAKQNVLRMMGVASVMNPTKFSDAQVCYLEYMLLRAVSYIAEREHHPSYTYNRYGPV